MRKGKRKILAPAKEEDRLLMLDTTLAPEVVSIMLDVPVRDVKTYRFTTKYKEHFEKATKKYREKEKQEYNEKFGKAHGCYRYWSAEDVEYLMTSEEPDSVIADKLNKTISAIQKKRDRLIKKGYPNVCR